jgi:YegS/Rv2252/BmrU family lipid kinase
MKMAANLVILLYNSHSGKKTFASHLDTIIEKFQDQGLQIVPFKITRQPEPIAAFLNSLNKEDVTKVLIAGGDGSVDICINAMLQADYHAPIAILPTGTANDMAHHLEIPTTLEGMLKIAMGSYTIPMDIGLINGKYFVNEASLGALIDVSQKTDQKVKNTFGMLGYYLQGIQMIPEIKPFDVRITIDGETLERRIFMMFVLNGSVIGGFKDVSPKASVHDGKFDVLIFNDCPPLEFLNTVSLFLRRVHFKSHYVEFIKTDNLYIETDKKTGVDIDGEKGPDFPLDIKLVPERFRICVHTAIR